MTVLILPWLGLVMIGLVVTGVLAASAGERMAGYGTLIACGVGLAGVLLHLLAGAPEAGMTIPFGIVGQSGGLAIDGLSSLFLALVLGLGMASGIASLEAHHVTTAPALPVFVAGMVLTLLAQDAVMLLLGFEAMSLASFVLVMTGHRDEAVRRAGLLYLGMAMLGALCLVAALGLMAGDGLSFDSIRAHPPQGARAVAVLVLVVIGAGSKAGLAPLHVWLPPAHAAAPGPVSALMSGAMTKVALYVIIRLLFDLAGSGQPGWFGVPLIVMGLAGAVIGALRANLETDIKAVLACSTVENVGLIAIALGLGFAARAADLPAIAGLAFGAALLHAMGHGMFKALLFLAAGSVQYGAGSREMARLGGLIGAMPYTAGAMLLGAACLAGLPPSSGFAGEWMLLQSVIAALRVGGLGVQVLVCVLAAGMAMAMALAAAASVRLVGVVMLGRPRTPRCAAAVESSPPVRWALILLGLGSLGLGLMPGALLGLAEPALQVLSTSFAQRASLLALVPQADAPGYAPLGILALLFLLLMGIAACLRNWAVAGYRHGPAWDCGFGAPPDWLPFGDPATQYGPGSMAQPLRRALGGSLLAARQSVTMPAPEDSAPARFTETAQDPAERLIFAPIHRLRATISHLADLMTFLTVRQSLSVLFAALVLFLAVIAALEQT